MSREERIRLIQEREEWPPNDISFDIRSDHFGGGFRLRGKFRLRSFAAILDFWGGSLGEEPDLDVPKDPRTPPVAENPVRTTNIMIANDVPEGADLFVAYRDRYYAVVTEGSHARWNRQAFRLLYHLFQMTVTEVPRVGVPSITIAK